MKRLGPSIAGRFGLMFLLFVVFPSLVLLVSLSQLALSSLYESSASQARETGRQILRNLTTEADIVSYQAGALLNDQDLQANVESYARAGSESGRATAATLIDRNLINFLNFSNKAGTVTLKTRGGGWYSYGNLPSRTGQLPENEALAAEALVTPGRVVFADHVAGDELTAAVAPGIGEQDAELQLILLRLKVAFLDDLRGPATGGRTEVILVGRRGQVLFSTVQAPILTALMVSPEFSTQGDRTQSLGGQVWLISGQQVEATGWRLLTLRNEADLTARFRAYEPWIFGGIVALILLFLGYTGLFFQGIARPIHAVGRSMDRVGEGAWGIAIPNTGLKELNGLVESFNRMSGEIVRLNQERVTVELDALRHQINPHFIANTLNVIKLMAATARLRPVEQMTGDLMVLLSDSYTGGTSLTDLAAELKNIESYVRIMKMRFDAGFDLVVEVPDEALGVLTLRMLLQPLVENAVIHGFASLTRRGTITLRARLEPAPEGFAAVTTREVGIVQDRARRLVLEVEDNGVGMDPAHMAQTRSDPLGTPDRLARIGLDNVDRRMKLHFGDTSGLSVESQSDAFTRVRLVLPLLRRSVDA